MKTAISIPDDIFRKAERMAKQRKVSRSQLYTAALVRLLDAEPQDDITRAYDSAFDDATRDPLIDAAARRALEGVEWSDE